MSNPPSPAHPIETDVPKDHPGFARFAEEAKKTAVRVTPEELKAYSNRPVRVVLDKNSAHARYLSSGPISFSGQGVPFVRPQIGNMLPLAKALGLDQDGGWKKIWKTVGEVKERERLCKLVWTVLEWTNEGNAGNTYTYCFCTKYLPSIIQAIIDEPSPSIFASPYDLIVRGIANTPLLGYYLRSRPDQAIKLRDVYCRKAVTAADAHKHINDTQLFILFMPNLIIVHTAIIAYLSSPLSTASQRAPPLPLPKSHSAALGPIIVRLNAVMDREVLTRRPKEYGWAGQVEENLIAFAAALVHRDFRTAINFPILDADARPTGLDYLACGISRPERAAPSVPEYVDPKYARTNCEERDPKKLKACARCQVVRYCCTEHQSLDWKYGKHKPFCQPILWDD